MIITPVSASDGLTTLLYRCDAQPGERALDEVHGSFSVSYVCKGSFGCHTRGRALELVPGSIMLGHPGEEFRCTHDHHAGGDECLSFHFSEELVDTFGASERWRIGCIGPLPELIVLGELGRAASAGACDLALDEVGTLLAARFVALASGRSKALAAPTPRDRRRAVDAALFIEAEPQDTAPLEQLARRAGLTPYHFLRLFTRVVGVSPHQYRIRCRLRRAAGLLADGELPVTAVALEAGFADLSNFVRTFHRAAGVSPRRFRQLALGNSKRLRTSSA